MSIPAIGSVFTLECLGKDPGGPRFLDGRTIDGTVGLAENAAASGTQWALTRLAQDVVTLKCMGDVEGNRFLGGSIGDESVGLQPHTFSPSTHIFSPYSGTRWVISEVAGGIVTLRCLRYVEGNRFLDGRTRDGSVGLAPDTSHVFSGTRWRIRVTGKLVLIFCLGHIDGRRFLDGRTADRTVGLSDGTKDPFTGTRWQMIGDDKSFALKCLGTGDGPLFLDGNTIDGSVRLAPHTGAPFSGTHWQMTSESALRCLGDFDGVRFLDGRTGDGTVALVASQTPAPTGTQWRIMTPCTSPVIDDVHAPVTVRIAQLTGSNDAEDRPIVNETDAWGARGLDLGANCEHLGKLYVFLSDVVRPQNSGPPTLDTDLVAHMDRSALGGHDAAGHNFVLPHAPTSLQGQPAWRYCGKCASLFFDGDVGKGVCAKGGGHTAAGLSFVIPFEHTDVPGQHDWRRCTKCKVMFFELFPDRGVCAAGGRHVSEGERFVLPLAEVSGSNQADWRFCQWCRGLFFAGDPAFQGTCVADGTAFRLKSVLKGNLYDPFVITGPIGETLNSETPTGAFSFDGQIYVFVWITGRAERSTGSYLVSKADPSTPGNYTEEFQFSNFDTAHKGFWQIAPCVVNNADIPGLPSQTGEGLLIFGQGRESKTADAIHLAWMPLWALGSGGQVRYQQDKIMYLAKPAHVREFHGGKGHWCKSEEDAAALITLRPGYTSLSVQWLEGPQRWILLYSKANDDLNKRDYAPSASVVAHIGTTPWDWSPEIEIFNPCREQAYGCYMHWPDFETIPNLVAPQMNNEAGWSYGAHLLNRFTKWHPETRILDIYYLLSLHRPYQTQVMLTKLHLP